MEGKSSVDSEVQYREATPRVRNFLLTSILEFRGSRNSSRISLTKVVISFNQRDNELAELASFCVSFAPDASKNAIQVA
jgi:hypothetical protein